MNWQRKLPKQLLVLVLVVLLGWSTASCSKSSDGTGVTGLPKAARSKLTEVSPPFVIQNLKQALDVYQPQVKIVSPRSNQVLDDTEVQVKLQVSDLSLYKDEELKLGPYLQVLLDNQPYTQVYDLDDPLTIASLSPGTHTLRVFAVQPWHESFKNDGAFAQTTFHVFTKTAENQPDPDQPLLTYNAPQGTIGAEPFLLDFYLTNAPLHLVARETTEDAISDWQVRCTINGESFTFDRWEPIYLKGLKPGRNWVQLELLDDKGNPLPNVFNNAVQLITYEPGGSDTLALITRGELTAEAARKIVDPNYVPPAPEPEVILEPDLTQEPVPEEMPPEMIAPAPTDTTEDSVKDLLEVAPELTSEPESEPEVELEPKTEVELETKLQPAAEPTLELDREPVVEETGEGTAAEVEPAPVAPVAPIVAPTKAPSEPSSFQIIIAPEGNAAPVEVKPTTLPVVPEPTVPESISEPISEPNLPAPEPNSLEGVKTRLEEVFQPDASERPETILLPEQLELTEPVQPLEPVTVTQPLLDSVFQSLEQPPTTPTFPLSSDPLSSDLLAPTAQATPESSLQPPEFPDMMNALDRVKGFFENLRKRPDEPSLPLLIEEVLEEVNLPSSVQTPVEAPLPEDF